MISFKKQLCRMTLVPLFFAVSLGAQAKTIKVQMLNQKGADVMVFDPGFVQAKIGDTIEFLPEAPGHNSVSVKIPKGAKSWSSPVGTTEPFKVKLDKAGVYIYECQPHSVMSMVGVIQVEDAKNYDEVMSFAETYKAKLAMNKERFEGYLKKIVR